MIIIQNTLVIKELRKFLSFLKLSIKQYFYFYYLNLVRSFRFRKNNSQRYLNSLIFSTSNSQYRSWHSYQKLCSIPSKKIAKKFDKKGEFIKYIRIIIPKGLRSLRKLEIKTLLINKKFKKNNLISNNYLFNKKDLAYFRDLNKIDIKLNSDVQEFSIKSSGTKIAFQIFNEFPSSAINYPSTIYVVLDAVSFKSFLNSETYKNFLSKSKHLLYETFSPSSLTGSALPSLLTLKPVFCHLLGDYDKWFFSPNLECLSKDIKTISEKLQNKIQESNAFTSFSKTMPFYGYFRGFNYYYNRCSGNNFSPSSLDLFFSYLSENKDFINSLGSSFNFIHDIGGHPPVIPSFDGTNYSHCHLAYLNSVDVSLSKIKSLILNLDSNGKLDETNIIITGDHTESFGFKRTNFSLYPERITVPVYLKPSINTNISSIKDVLSVINKKPSSFVISEIFRKIYDLDFSHPEFIFDNVIWLSSVFKYPRRKIIYTLGYDNLTGEYICAKIDNSLFNISERFIVENLKPKLFKYNRETLLPLNVDSKNYQRVLKSFRRYVLECHKQISYPIKQFFL